MKINGIYRHYKGNFYRVIAIAKHTETQDDLVIYEALYGKHNVWCRPIEMWNELLEIDGKQVKRFEFVEDYNG